MSGVSANANFVKIERKRQIEREIYREKTLKIKKGATVTL